MGLKTPKNTGPEVGELVALVRDLVQQQSEVLKVAMETQKAQAEVLAKWISMFTPSSTPNQSTSEADRIRMREELKESSEWEPVDFNGMDPFKDLN